MSGAGGRPSCSWWGEPASNIYHQERHTFFSPTPAVSPGAAKAAASKVLLVGMFLASSMVDSDKNKHGQQGTRWINRTPREVCPHQGALGSHGGGCSKVTWMGFYFALLSEKTNKDSHPGVDICVYVYVSL